MAGSPADLDRLPADLKLHVVQLLEEDARHKAEMAALREELAPPKGSKAGAQERAKGRRKHRCGQESIPTLDEKPHALHREANGNAKWVDMSRRS